jgi:hypothetical protein
VRADPAAPDGRLDVKFFIPGAPGAGTNPEQLFAAGWSACFEGAMAIVARKRKMRLAADTAIDAEMDLNQNLADRAHFLRARLNVSLPGCGPGIGAGHRQLSAPDMPVLSSNTGQHRRGASERVQDRNDGSLGFCCAAPPG